MVAIHLKVSDSCPKTRTGSIQTPGVLDSIPKGHPIVGADLNTPPFGAAAVNPRKTECLLLSPNN
jgi:hypothetical protein